MLNDKSSEDAAAVRDEATQQLKYVHTCCNRAVVFLFWGFFTSHHPEEKLLQALPWSANWDHTGEQDVRQSQTSALGLSHLWGWREQLVSRSAADQAL